MEFFLKRYRQIDESVDIIEELRPAIRINTSMVSHEQVIKALEAQGAELEKIEWLEDGYWTTAEFSLGSTKEYLLGWYYLQAPLSQLTSELLAPEGDVLDMAAAPGSKTTHIAQMQKGVVLAVDNDSRRLASVRNNAERLRLPNVVCVKKDSRFVHELGRKFKWVLLDAPCSGNFCSEPNWDKKRTIQDIKKNARIQKQLIKAAYASLESGGTLLYSTCSLEPEENECVINWALNRYDDLELQNIPADIGDAGTTEWDGLLNPEIAKTKRFWPHKTGCEGFFVAILKKA